MMVHLMDHLRAYKAAGTRMGHTTCGDLDLNIVKMTKHILLAQNTVPNSKLDQNTQNLTGQCGRLAQGEELRADTWGPMRRDDMGRVVGSSAVVNGLGSAQGQCH
jgi:hypothetical protein